MNINERGDENPAKKNDNKNNNIKKRDTNIFPRKRDAIIQWAGSLRATVVVDVTRRGSTHCAGVARNDGKTSGAR